MVCPMCAGTNVNVQVVTETKVKKKHHNPVWWIFVGWYWVPIKWVFLTIPALIVKIFAPKRKKVEQKHISMCVCQDCGYNWKIEQ